MHVRPVWGANWPKQPFPALPRRFSGRSIGRCMVRPPTGSHPSWRGPHPRHSHLPGRCHCPGHPPCPRRASPPAPAAGRAPAARTLQTDVIGVLPVIEQGCVIPKKLGISPTFVAPHGAHRGGRAQGRLRLRQRGAGHQVAELHLRLLRHGCFGQGLPVGLGLRAQLGGGWPQGVLLGLFHVWKEKGGCHWPCHPSPRCGTERGWICSANPKRSRSRLPLAGTGSAGDPFSPQEGRSLWPRARGEEPPSPHEAHGAPCQPQQHRVPPPLPVPTSLFSRDWSSSDTFRKTSSSVVSISPKLVRSSSSRLCSRCCGGKALCEEGRRSPQRCSPPRPPMGGTWKSLSKQPFLTASLGRM